MPGCPTATLIALVLLATKDRSQLVLENIALRYQRAVYWRSVGRPNVRDWDRLFGLTLMRVLREWHEAFVIVQPDAVIRQHRKGFQCYWRWKSRFKPGRPPISMAVTLLIRRMSSENATWGAPRIKVELALLGHGISISTVAKYMVRKRESEPGPYWKAFLRNHVGETAACDFFVVPTVTFQRLFVFVVRSPERRCILHVNATMHPTAEWVALRVRGAFLGDGWTPRFVHRDPDGAYGWAFGLAVKTMGITELMSAPRSPSQDAHVERLIGSARRECTDLINPQALP